MMVWSDSDAYKKTRNSLRIKRPKIQEKKTTKIHFRNGPFQMGDSFLEDIEIFDQYIDEVNYIFPPQSCALNEQVLFYIAIGSTSA